MRHHDVAQPIARLHATRSHAGWISQANDPIIFGSSIGKGLTKLSPGRPGSGLI